MKTKILIIIVLTIGFGLVILFRGAIFSVFEQKQKVGRIIIESSPSASIFINDNDVGRTPLQSFQIDVGEYTVKLIPEGIAPNTDSWQGKVPVMAGSDTYLSVNLGKNSATTAVSLMYFEDQKTNKDKGNLIIETDPTGAIVYLDNDEKGVAPVSLVDVPVGDHEVKASLPFFFSRSERVKVVEGKVLRIKFKLALDESQKRIDLPEEQATDSAQPSAENKAKTYVKINADATGWLRVRSEAGLSGKELARVKNGAEFELLDEENGWYKIKFNGRQEDLESGEFAEGWISSNYAVKIDSSVEDNANSNATDSAR
ncbi:MAG: hypothetical protein KatS3mg090_0257 [Patescibacteria group bacterium]|nr:MAG: hypothetical protein KatS3mg090_0257 [Patescibacteria group bacterium]